MTDLSEKIKNQIKPKKENKMSKEVKEKTTMTVEVKVALPWTLLAAIVLVIAVFISGMSYQSSQHDQVKAEASAIVQSATPLKQ